MTEESKEDFEQFYQERFGGRIFSGTEFKKIASDIWESAQEVALAKDHAIIQQQVQLDKTQKCTHPESYIFCCHYYSDSDLCSALSGPCEST